MRAYVQELQHKSQIPIFEHAFLDVAPPSIPKGIEVCVNKGATEIIILLNFLNAGQHVDEDIPYIVNECREKYPDVKFDITKPVGQHDQVIDLFLDLINKSKPA